MFLLIVVYILVFASPSHLTVLEDNSVHTVISIMQVSTSEAGAAEINLVKAATRSSHAKRFISSEWSVSVPDT